jgi:hypothetical protein
LLKPFHAVDDGLHGCSENGERGIIKDAGIIRISESRKKETMKCGGGLPAFLLSSLDGFMAFSPASAG